MRMMWRICSIVVFLTLINYCSSQNATICMMAASCAECISLGPDCSWCAQRDFYGEPCDLTSTMIMSNCTDIQNPVGAVNITKDEDLSNAGDAALGQAVQVKPQEIHLKIRKGETETIRMDVRQAEDYPVDLYFLMDLTGSMQTYLSSLNNAATQIVDTMRNLTSNFRVGFGSFVDKTVVPFTALIPNRTAKLPDFCRTSECDYPYLFRNRQTLTEDANLFKNALDNTVVSYSQDSPEAGFDALVQVAVCTDVIGWREDARHLVIYLTDARYHTAGDGRVGGIVTPNDGQCHVDPSTGYYSIDKFQDYPSLGQASSLIKEKDISMLFAVTDKVDTTYDNVLPFFPGSERTALGANTDNMISIVTSFYDSITSRVSLSVQAPEELHIAIDAQCPFYVDEACIGLKVGDTVGFDISITAESCIEGGSTSLSISPVGFSEELHVQVDILCDCDCEKQGTPNSPDCSFNGTSQCGRCDCNEGWYGDVCQCSGESSTTGDERRACVASGSASVCSGRGECICGECVCNKRNDPTEIISGKFCQCDNFNCPLFEGQLCGGPTRGVCECDTESQQSKCRCTEEYEGDNCNCLRSTEACVAPNGLICNAHGSCTCGACRCEIDSPFKGTTCSDCATCAGQCEVYQECVQCKAFNSGPLSEEQCDMCTVEIKIVEKFPEVEYPYNCSVTHSDNCSIVFIPHFVNGEDSVPVIYVLEKTVCPPGIPAETVNPIWIAVGLIIFIVVIGIILIILYKLYITWLDRKEFREWEKDRANAQFSENENPLYKPASTVHKNPAFGTQFSGPADDALPQKS